MRITNLTESDQVRVVSSDKFTIVNGHPRFNTTYVTIPAKATSEEWIKPVYREGWSL